MTEEQKALVESHYNLIHWVIHRLPYTVSDYDDYVQVGAIGLCRAALKFNPELGIKFLTYAVQGIRMAIMDYNAKHDSLLKLPTNFYRYATDEDKNAITVMSLECAIDEDTKATYLDMLTDSEDSTAANAVINVEFVKVLQNLDQRDAQIFQRYLSGYNQNDIGKEFGLNQSYVSRILARIKNRLAKELTA